MPIFSWRSLAATLLCVVALAGCESRSGATTSGSESRTGAAPADSAAAPVVAAYICPMECEGSASDTPGKCPVCEMDLEPNPAYKSVAQ